MEPPKCQIEQMVPAYSKQIMIDRIEFYEMLKCLGCDNIKMCNTTIYSDDLEPAVSYFPPSIFRKEPIWLYKLFAELPGEEKFVYELLREVHKALQNNQPYLAAMGIRALLEQVMIAKVSDHNSFAKHLSEFENRGFVSRIQRERLETILDAGHATIHRAFKPSLPDLVTLVNVAESIIETVYLHENDVARLRKNVPKREKKRNDS